MNQHNLTPYVYALPQSPLLLGAACVHWAKRTQALTQVLQHRKPHFFELNSQRRLQYGD